MWCHLSAKLHLSLVTTFSHTYPWLSVILFLHLIIYPLEAVGFLTLGDSSPFGLTKSDMTALQSCFGFPSSVTVNSTIFFPPPPGSTCYGKVSFDCSLPYLKMIVGLFCTSFFFFFLLGLPMLCLFSAFPPQNACCQQDNHLCFLFLQMHWKSRSSGCMWCITRLKMKTKAIAARLCFLRCSENYSSVILSGAGVFWSAHLCTSIHLNLLFVNPLFLTLVDIHI